METNFVEILLLALCLIALSFWNHVSLKRRMVALEKDMLDMKTYYFERNLRDVLSGEKRLKWRAEKKMPAVLWVGDLKHEVMIEDLSKTGVHLKTSALKLNHGTSYPLEFDCLGEGLLNVHVTVVRVDLAPYHYGCVFQDLTVADRNKIGTLIHEDARQDILKTID